MSAAMLGHAFRRAALPLAWYYAVTLALPLANGAAYAGAAFVAHALAVLVVPPLLIVLLCVIQKSAEGFAGACRAALLARGRAPSASTAFAADCCVAGNVSRACLERRISDGRA